MKLFIAADHAGFDRKEELKQLNPQIQWMDLGTVSSDRVDYPDYAEKVVKEIERQPEGLGVLICGSGQGMAIKANRYPFIRAALCLNEDMAKLAREHNNANILCLGSRFTDSETCSRILRAFLEAKFEGGRHQDRVNKLGC